MEATLHKVSKSIPSDQVVFSIIGTFKDVKATTEGDIKILYQQVQHEVGSYKVGLKYKRAHSSHEWHPARDPLLGKATVEGMQ